MGKLVGTLRGRFHLQYLIYPVFVVFLFTAPLMRGLFFVADLLPHVLMLGIALLFASVNVIIKNERVFPGVMPLLFLWLALSYGVSCFAAVSKPEAFRGFLRYLTYFGVFWLAGYLSRERRGRRALVLTVFLSATVLSAVGLLSATGVDVFPGASTAGRIMSTLQYPNALAAYLMFSSVIGLGLVSTESSWVTRVIYALALFGQTLAFLSSYSRGGWVVFPVAVAIAFLGMPKTEKSRLAYHACTTLTAVLLVARRFSESVEGKTPAAGQRYILIGFFMALFFQIAYSVFARISQSLLSRPARTALSWVGGAYAAIILVAYLVALAGQYSGGLSGMVSPRMFSRFASISVDDPSLITRAFATKDALRIFLDYPLVGGGAGAWNALYHRYQRVLYWTTEVHNHYAQVLVETGILGFAAYASIWGALAFSVVRSVVESRKQGLWDDSRDGALVWGLFAACVGVGIHSFMDFELSMAGFAVQLWAIMGVVWQSVTAQTTPRDSAASVSRRPESGYDKANRRIAGVFLTVLSLALILVSFSLQRGAWYGSLGAAALSRQDFHTAVKAYEEARKYDPLTASYSMDMGQAYAAMALLENSESLKDRALARLSEGRRLDPTNLAHRIKEVEVLVSLGEVGEATKVSRQVVDAVPLDIRAYESYARLCVVTYMNAERKARSTESIAPPDLGESCLLDDVAAIPARLEELRGRVVGVYKERWDPKKLEPTFSLNTYLGQAYYLGGDLETASAYLDKAIASYSKASEAQVWRTAISVLEGRKPPGQVTEDVLNVVSFFHPSPR